MQDVSNRYYSNFIGVLFLSHGRELFPSLSFVNLFRPCPTLQNAAVPPHFLIFFSRQIGCHLNDRSTFSETSFVIKWRDALLISGDFQTIGKYLQFSHSLRISTTKISIAHNVWWWYVPYSTCDNSKYPRKQEWGANGRKPTHKTVHIYFHVFLFTYSGWCLLVTRSTNFIPSLDFWLGLRTTLHSPEKLQNALTLTCRIA